MTDKARASELIDAFKDAPTPHVSGSLKAAQPDCRTCAFFRAGPALHADNCYRNFEGCTNGDKYQPAPKVVLWRTE